MTIASVMEQDVEIALGIGGERLPKVFDQLRVEFANLGEGIGAWNTKKLRPLRSMAVVTSVSSIGRVRLP